MKTGFSIESLRSTLIRQAYYITGSMDDAEDVVHDAYLQWSTLDIQHIKNPQAYLMRIVTNMAINLKEKLKRQRAAYFGQWLPEPVSDSSDKLAAGKDSLSYSLLVLLESLSAKERAVFILREAFGYEHHEIGQVLEIAEVYSRKLLSRAKARLATDKRQPVSLEQQQAFLERFLQAIWSGDTSQVEALLREDATVISDGGGKVPAGKHPVTGRLSIAKMLTGLYRKFYRDALAEPLIINGQPAILYWKDDILVNCQIFDINAAGISNVYFVRNPDKLNRLAEKKPRPMSRIP
ncbi:sigma factor-like helix-turn-helix DNA-binding protein [Parapedobacter deserti]|uniref:Sigma factor-like helix-turn-helix DNA-binding protein n=1 Tax=Parapedobacter deserti TaxID=1912957 RepID=A0ABV7JNQ4_9SPHI